MRSEIAVCGDLHKGLGSVMFLEEMVMFHVKQFIPYLQNRGVKTVVFLGDIFDNRRQLDIFMLNRILELFDYYEKCEIEIRIIVGNHDTNLKNTNSVNSLKILKKYSNIKIYEETEVDEINGVKCLFVPWQYDLNKYVEYVNSKVLDDIQISFGHFDVVNAMMNRSTRSKVGFGMSDVMKFPIVYSGHYHSRSITESEVNGKKFTLIYTGTPYQLNRGDRGEAKGFFIQTFVDGKVGDYEFVENTVSPRFIEVTFPEEFSEDDIRGNIVDIVYSEKDDVDAVQEYKERVSSYSPFSTSNKMLSVAEIEGVDEIKFTNVRQIFDEYIERVNVEECVRDMFIDTLKTLFDKNYIEA